jgi:hypothetical protein
MASRGAKNRYESRRCARAFFRDRSVEREASRSEAMERGRLRDGFAGMEGEAGRFP